MCSDCDGESDIPQTPPVAQEAVRTVTRRGLIIGGMVTALAACVRGSGAETPGSGEGTWYTSLQGDSLNSLAKRTGLAVDRIAKVNGISGGAVLKPGTRLWMPGVRFVAPASSPYQPPQARLTPQRPVQKPAAPIDDDHYELVPRSAWTSEPVGANHVLMGKVQKITIHHTDEHGGMDGKGDLDIVRMIENFHRGPQKRWAAIGYHFLVGKDGKIYEGRPVKFQGAHCGKNENNLGISVIGNCHHNLPNPRQLKALQAFLDDQRDRFNVPKSQVYGHRDIKPTICPGDRLYGWVLGYSGRA